MGLTGSLARVGRAGHFRSMVAATCLVVAATVAAPVVAGATLPSWHLNRSFTSPIQSMTGVDCTSTLHCVATTANGRIATTFNGWASFSSVAAKGKKLASTMNAVSCASASACEAVGSWGTSTTGYGVIMGSKNGGATWVTQHVSPVPHDLQAISCPSALVCVAVGVMGGHTEYFTRTTNGGLTWSDHTGTIAPSIGGLSSVSCVSTLTCSVIGIRGEAASTTNGGATWNIGTAYSTTRWLYSISCVGKGFCAAAGQNTKGQGLNLRSSNSGLTWSLASTGPGVSLEYAVTCSDSSHCVGVGVNAAHGVVVRTNSGLAYSTMVVPSGSSSLNAIVCRGATWCQAVGATSGSNAVVFTWH